MILKELAFERNRTACEYRRSQTFQEFSDGGSSAVDQTAERAKGQAN